MPTADGIIGDISLTRFNEAASPVIRAVFYLTE